MRQNIPKELIRAEVKEDHMAQHVGASGSLYITPRFMVFDQASDMVFENQPDLYAIRFSLENDPSRKITCENGFPSEGEPKRYDWGDSR